jgi:hypothetical protein
MDNVMTADKISKSTKSTKSTKSNSEDVIKASVQKVALYHSKEIVSAVVIGIIVTVVSTFILNGRWSLGEEFQHYDTIEQPSQDITQTNRVVFVRSQLSQVLGMLSLAKITLTEYYMMEGVFPKTNKEFNVSHLDLNENDLIDDSFLIEAGVGISLSEKFGVDKSLALIASPSKNGAFLKWHCETNIEPKFLGVGSRKICEFNSNVPFG